MDLNPWVNMALAPVLAVLCVLGLSAAEAFWRVDDWQARRTVWYCRVMAAFAALLGVAFGLGALAHIHAALYGWGVL